MAKQKPRRFFHHKRKNVKNFQLVMSDLPLIRTECLIPSFTNTGVDMFEPIFIKHRRARLKKRGCLFTSWQLNAPASPHMRGIWERVSEQLESTCTTSSNTLVW